MPEPRRLESLRFGAYDDPPASSESSAHQNRRRERLRRALRETREATRDTSSPREMSSSERRRLGIIGPPSRRRQRSSSPNEDDELRSEIDDSRSRRTKRRRLDQTPSPQPRKSIKYGHYGQVEAGRLKLELVSCDGGEHRDPRNPSTSLGAENLLRHDKSVYCSERPKSTIIFRHQDDTPFCLEKLHIVGPEHGFTAPVRAGVVYVAMTMSDLQQYIEAPFQPREQHMNRPYRRRNRDRSIRSSPERLTLADALRDPEINETMDTRQQERTRVSDAINELTGEDSYYGTDFGFGRTDAEAHCEIPTPAQISGGSSTPDSDDENPVTILFDEEPGPEDASSQEVLDYRLQRLRMMRRRFDLENYGRDDHPRSTAAADIGRMPLPEEIERERETGMWNVGRLDALMARSRVHDSETPEALDEEDELFPAIPPGRAGEHNVIAARFIIKRGKNKVAIKFDPPVSGRFIMMKVWAGRSNVDVQSVIAKGYGGCRFFPSRSFR